jgi:hypothetical protein
MNRLTYTRSHRAEWIGVIATAADIDPAHIFHQVKPKSVTESKPEGEQG